MLRRTLTASLMFFLLVAPYFACSASSKIDPRSSGSGDDVLNLDTDSESIKQCITSKATEVSTSRPVDIIFVIDNSGSMAEEIAAISDNINKHFVDSMVAAGLDYRVIMIVFHGKKDSWNAAACFEEPLSTVPVGGCATIGNNPPGNKLGKFYHYSYDVQSNDSFCIILDTLTASNNRPDMFGLAPGGWINWLRKSAFKVFIEVTDDSPGCWWFPDASQQKGKKSFNDFYSNVGGQIVATEFDKLITKLAPDQFGTPQNRNYAFFSIVGMLEKPEALDDDTALPVDINGKPEDSFSPSDGIVSDTCSTAVAPGFGYQWLSKITGGLRFPVCQAEKFDVVFEKISKSIDSMTASSCSVEIPTAGAEGNIDINTVSVDVEDQNGATIKLVRVDSSASCTGSPDEFYVDAASSVVNLCPTTCLEVKSVSKEITMTAGCSPRVN